VPSAPVRDAAENVLSEESLAKPPIGGNSGWIRSRRSALVAPAVVVILTITLIAGVWLLVAQSNSSRVAQLRVTSLELSLANLQYAPFEADPALGTSAASGLAQIRTDERTISAGLAARLQDGVPSALVNAARADLAKIEPVVAASYRTAIQTGGLAADPARILSLEELSIVDASALSRAIKRIGDADADRASRAQTQTVVGAAAGMLLLMAAFEFFYLRALVAREAVERLARDREALLGITFGEARTDPLTGLGNRRALTDDLAQAISQDVTTPELLLATFDLDGFKQYNDTFGHPAGDALLERLGGRLLDAGQRNAAAAYRIGGDEFCVIARCTREQAGGVVEDAIDALHDAGEGWSIGCSHGVVWLPSEASTAPDALKLVDKRLYADKAGRSSTSKQVADALLRVLAEQDASLDVHGERVATLAGELAEDLGLSEHEIQRIRLAAKLHDVGKTAIPAAIRDKPGSLDPQEWEFVHSHPAIGARIVAAAPALASTAPLILASHERLDGKGYPEGLAGDEIPLGARIIALCDAFEAMTSDRVYRRAMSLEAALEELKRGSGTQFDPTAVDTFCRRRSDTSDARRSESEPAERSNEPHQSH
jgi:diguanylate cyclase (GGDEF)-like protein